MVVNRPSNLAFLLPLVVSTFGRSEETHCQEGNTIDNGDSRTCNSAPEDRALSWSDFDWRTYVNKDWREEEDAEDPEKRFGINLRSSIAIGVNRTVPDNRPRQCSSVDWLSHGPLPDASVIVTYRDEPRSTLLRTVVSVIERSPPELLREIILVDDNNDDQTVGEELRAIRKVRVLRNARREGLIRSRIKGTMAAEGEVLVFLDSHCEVEPGWLEPLLSRVRENPRRLASPVIENINLSNFGFEPVSTFLRGGFDWNLDFFWEWLPAPDRARRTRDPTYSFKTPAIAGGLFAIDRKWFSHLGTYDEGLEIWGGENIEFSLRVWTCGGEMEIVPCSKVGHVYKQRNVYSYPRGNRRTTTCNTRRVADAWLDQFAQIYYLTLNSEQRGYECGDVAQVRQRREQLGCKPFKWYLENIYPELQVPLESEVAFGEIHFGESEGFLKCLDSVATGEEHSIGGNTCLRSFHPHQFRMTDEGLIKQDDFCLALLQIRTGTKVVSSLCDSKRSEQLFARHRPKKKKNGPKLKGYQLRHQKHDLCLDVTEIKEGGLAAYRCDPTSPGQRFLFTYDIVKV